MRYFGLIFIALSGLFLLSCQRDKDCPSQYTLQNGSCECEEGYTGSHCNIIADSCLIFEIECGPNGTCRNGECDCYNGFSGEICEFEDVCVSGSLNCGRFTCTDGTCDCPELKRGERCLDWEKEMFGSSFDIETFDVNEYNYRALELKYINGSNTKLRFKEIVSNEPDVITADATMEFQIGEYETIETGGIEIRTSPYGIHQSPDTYADLVAESDYYEVDGDSMTITFEVYIREFYRSSSSGIFSDTPNKEHYGEMTATFKR